MTDTAFIVLAGIVAILFAIGTSKTGQEGVISRMAEAIKSFEGWAVGSRSQRNNNPGNLKYAGQVGAISQDEEGHAIFDSYASGWAALIHQLTLAFTGESHVYSPEDSLYDFFRKYAEANSAEYAAFVAGQLGVSPDTSLNQLA